MNMKNKMEDYEPFLKITKEENKVVYHNLHQQEVIFHVFAYI